LGMPELSSHRTVVVIGAGAAGTMAAIFAASAGADTLLLEGTKDGGRKILISGGGRCNVLPLELDESRFVTDSSPNTLKRILRSWPLNDQRRFFEEDVGIPLSEEPEQKKVLPSSHRARDVRERGAQIRFETRVTDLTPSDGRWRVALGSAPPVDADAVILATGGLSVPNTGSDGVGLEMARRLGHTMHNTYAALTPLTDASAHYAALAGISLPVTLSARGAERRASHHGGFLFTHQGYSGPAALNVSHVAVRTRQDHVPQADVRVQWTALGDAEWESALKPQGSRSVLAAVRAHLPDRLATHLLADAGVDPARLLSELRREERLRLLDALVRGPLPWTCDEGYKKAEVTLGGVDTRALSQQTMECKTQPGLYFIGEVVDVTGWLGGYNFQWAWASAHACAQALPLAEAAAH